MKATQSNLYSYHQVRAAIMEEIGTDERTISNTIKKLKELKLIEGAGMGLIKLNLDKAV